MVWELTQSPALTGLTAFLILAMPGILGPFFGVWIENLDPKRVIVWVQFLNLGVYLALAIIAYVGTESAVPYLIASGATGMVIAIWQPARLVLPTLLVSDHALGSAVAINSTLFNTARIIGPALAAWAIAFGGVVLAFFAGFLLYAFFFFAVLFLRTQHVKKDRPRGSFLDRLLGGIRQARAIPIVALAMAATMFSGFFGRSVVELMPAINGALITNGSAQTLGYLTSAAGAGAILMGLWLATRRSNTQQMLGVLVRRRHHRRPRRLRHGFRSLCLGAVAAFADFWRSGQSDARWQSVNHSANSTKGVPNTHHGPLGRGRLWRHGVWRCRKRDYRFDNRLTLDLEPIRPHRRMRQCCALDPYQTAGHGIKTVHRPFLRIIVPQFGL